MIFEFPRLRLYTRAKDYAFAVRNLFFPYGGSELTRAETDVANFVGADYAIACSMGRMAMFEGLKAALTEGDEVIMSPLTVPECVSLMLALGVKPVFVDVNRDTWCLDSELVSKAITSRTKAILATHLYGFVAELDKLAELAADNNLMLIEMLLKPWVQVHLARKLVYWNIWYLQL